MMRVQIPIKIVNGQRWGDLSVFGLNHEICAERGEKKDDAFSFAGGHRVRLFRFRKNVHWKIPDGIDLDISGVVPEQPPRRNQGR